MSPLLLTVNGIPLEQQVVVEHQGRYYGPVREIFSALGGYTTWLPREGQVVVRWANHLAVITAAKTVITLNGEKKILDQQSVLIGGYLYAPLESLARAFAGSLLQDEGTLRLFLPKGHLTGVGIEREALHLNWTAGGIVDADQSGNRLALSLKDTTWPTNLRRLCIERQPCGWLDIVVETSGGQLSHALGERSIKVEWQGAKEGPLTGLTFAIDAGHGGSDLGVAGSSGALEKDLVRSIADKLMTQLLAAGAGVIDVRSKDQRISVDERVGIARKGGANALVSIHLNGYDRASSQGTETFYYDGNHKGAILADIVQGNLVKHLKLRNRGIKEASFSLLRALPDIPAVLTEIGSLTNGSEERFLGEESNQRLAAYAIFCGIQEFAAEHKSLFVG